LWYFGYTRKRNNKKKKDHEIVIFTELQAPIVDIEKEIKRHTMEPVQLHSFPSTNSFNYSDKPPSDFTQSINVYDEKLQVLPSRTIYYELDPVQSENDSDFTQTSNNTSKSSGGIIDSTFPN